MLDQAARRMLLYAPMVPYELALAWAGDVALEIVRARFWSWRTAEGSFEFPDAYTVGRVTLTKGSPNVVGVGTSWTSVLESLQLKIGGLVYTVQTVADPLNLTLSSNARVAATDAGYIILKAYVNYPADLHTILSATDPTHSRSLAVNRYTVEDLDVFDPRREVHSSPLILAALSGRRFEAWPHATSATTVPLTYVKLPLANLLPADFPFDVLELGVRRKLTGWPGGMEQRNPMFDINASRLAVLEFRDKINELAAADNEVYNRNWKEERPGYSLGPSLDFEPPQWG